MSWYRFGALDAGESESKAVMNGFWPSRGVIRVSRRAVLKSLYVTCLRSSRTLSGRHVITQGAGASCPVAIF